MATLPLPVLHQVIKFCGSFFMFILLILLWLKTLMQDLGFVCKKPMLLHCNNNSVCHIAKNPSYHETTEHIEVDCHFIREKVTRQEIVLVPTHTVDQLVDFLKKAIIRKQMTSVFSKPGLVDIYLLTSLRRSVEDRSFNQQLGL